MDIIWASGAQDLGSIPSGATKKRTNDPIGSLFNLSPSVWISSVPIRFLAFLFSCVEVFKIVSKAEHYELL